MKELVKSEFDLRHINLEPYKQIINEIKNNRDQSLLYVVSRKGNLQLVNKLLSLDINVNILNSDNSTPLHGAAFGFSHENTSSARIDIIKQLLLKKAKKELRNNNGNTAFLDIQFGDNSDTDKVQMIDLLR